MQNETKCDIVLLATGYDFYFPLLDNSIIPMKVRLFKNMFQPNLKHPHTLAMINLVHPIGSFNPIFEMQSRWFALLMKGERKLPNKSDMIKTIDEDIKHVENGRFTQPVVIL
ncbi:dimethylaniline monooxygenase [N-oxide-forming] 5-like protein [Leptotrombidium deliense]|uniref:Flavin-containing monooxygenase n=1 Tax=Leptotrombidium deliense TaxID=299467 RepID=A0A443RW98_9ACAR|nr:dimethylaniline monooxygenase [N-oxide-forming] 5-like protein [Leptotrombidium deliense]